MDEVREADLILHIVDISHPSFEDHIAAVNKIMEEIGAVGKPVIMVFNKIDNYHPVEKDPDDLSERKPENVPLEELKATWMNRMNNQAVFISAIEKTNIAELKELIYKEGAKIHQSRFPYSDFLYELPSEEV